VASFSYSEGANSVIKQNRLPERSGKTLSELDWQTDRPMDATFMESSDEYDTLIDNASRAKS